ncbi:oxidoreductase NAD-binding domain-containing protein [Thelonectria olida]|uniref:Oxidoreductase NAD-binding domain-containing protein n=1 Tax=Thelonectria olida TaxID=1576542 RepID=A0A9P8VPK2_9HYPO|nr:oxidoreductase NAD-binding domain-containing protein [Thelonectria olida]
MGDFDARFCGVTIAAFTRFSTLITGVLGFYNQLQSIFTCDSGVNIHRRQPASTTTKGTVSHLSLGVMPKELVRHASTDSRAPLKVFSGGPAFVFLKLESFEVVNDNVKRLRFSFPKGDAVSGLTLTCIWMPVARPYTPISSLNQQGFLDLLVKQYSNGKQSTHLHSLEPGQALLFAAALKGFSWKPKTFPHINMVTGGAGVTPIYQLANGILRNPEDKTTISLTFAANTEDDLVLKKELDALENEFAGRLAITYLLSNPNEGSSIRQGRHENTKVFVCGPPGMESSLAGKTGILQQLGYRKDQIFSFQKSV